MKAWLTEGVVTKSWCEDPEPGALEQVRNLAKLPFAFKHVALMPDAHQGYGMPIGGVLAADGVIVPNAVGVDIGCGMCAAQTDINGFVSQEQLKQVLGRIREAVPVGMRHHKAAQILNVELNGKESQKEAGAARFQVGTLGGGNHFIEIQRADDKSIWVMIHSGSRNVGKKVADTYNKLAIDCNARWRSAVPKEWQLAFLPLESDEGQAYLNDMNLCLHFARENRALMLTRVLSALASVIPGFEVLQEFDVHHNYARLEHHFGRDVVVHRKGATSAREGEKGIIPGSQGTKSYIVEGLGNPESFTSCSHGAGRKMGRKEAVRKLNFAEEVERLDKQGIVHAIRGKQDLEEAAGAYKDIASVMEQQKDLVKIVYELTPMAVVKG